MKKLKKNKEAVQKKRISSEIARRVGTPAGIVFIVVAIAMMVMVWMQVMQAKEKELTLESESAANNLNAFFQEYLRSVEQFALDPEVIKVAQNTKPGDNIREADDFESVINNMVSMQKSDSDNILAVWIADIDANAVTSSDGYLSGDDFDVTTREWYAVTQTGEAALTQPYLDASSGSMVLTAAAPIMNPDTNEAIGVVGLDILLTHVDEVLKTYEIGDAGYVIMTTSQGVIIYHPDESLIQKNLTELGMSDNVVSTITSKESDFVRYQINGDSKYGYITQVGDTGYMVLSNMPSSEYFRVLFYSVAVMIVIFVLGIVIIMMAIRKVSKQITLPIEKLNAAAQELAEGNLQVELDVASDDEIGALGDSIQKTVERLKTYIVYIDEISAVLEAIADGRLVIDLQSDYAGEFGKVKDAMMNISTSMSDVLRGINESAAQVSGGAENLADASQGLAEGAGMQAAAVEELVATTEDIVTKVQDNQKAAQDSAIETKKVTKLAETSKTQMEEMLLAMQRISETSKEVVGIIHTIEEIADQTNLLSLNASIEAARAGEVGRGFAVVATEIGSLATESANAANTTREMIEICLREIENGASLADGVTESLKEVVEGIESVNQKIELTADLSEKQAESMEQIKLGIENIAQGVQDNSATAEESSATSEELASQAALLNEMVQKFELDES